MKKAVLLILFHFLLHSNVEGQHFVFYGITGGGGKYNDGVIYSYDPVSGQYKSLFSLDGTNGQGTWAGLTLANDGLLYGLTEDGGSKNYGVMFSYNRFNNKDSVLINCDSIHTGAYDVNGNCMMQSSKGLLYGTREWGGSHDSGILYSYNIITGKDSIILNFNTKIGALPNRTLIEDTNTGLLYGTTLYGGKYGFGVIFCYNSKTGKDSIVLNYDSVGENGIWPKGNTFCLASNSLFYGMTAYGGAISDGTLYSFNPKTGKDTTLIRFTGSNGIVPAWCNLIQAEDGLLYGMTLTGGSNSDGVLFSFDIATNKQKVLVNFNGNNGNEPTGDLVQDPDNGLLYGITEIGGSNNMGVIFCYNPISGKDSVLVNFDGTNGAYPVREPTLVRDTPNAVSELKIKNEKLIIYPNPNKGVFALQMANGQQMIANSQIEIYNELGEKVYNKQWRTNDRQLTIDISSQPSGIYLYRIVDNGNNLLKADKVIIIH